MDWGIVSGREQEGQVAAPTVGVPTSYPPPNWGPSYPNVGPTEYGSNCSAAPSYATAAPFDFSAPDSRGFNPVTTFENNSNSHHHYNTTSPPFSLSQTAGVRTPRDGFFSPPLSPPMPGGHVVWAPQSATGISERSLFLFQQQQPHSAHDDGSGFTSVPASAAVAAQFSPRSSRSAASPYSSPTFTAGHCSAVSWTSSPPPPEDHHAANVVEMAKPVSRTETTKTTLKGARDKGVPATTKPAAGPSPAGKSLTKAAPKFSKGNYSRVSKGTPMKASNATPKKTTKTVLKKELSEEDDDDHEDDIPSGTTASTLTSALSPDKFPTLEAYKTYMRDWHNRIGRKYRNKLNEQFENLLAVLQLEEARRLGPKDPHRSLTGIVIQGSKKHTTIGRGPNAINKAKLLNIARQRVEEIADERDALLAERDQLLRRLQEMGA